MALITHVQPKNIWDEICKEAAAMRPPFVEADAQSVSTVKSDYNPAKHTPVFYGRMHHKLPCPEAGSDFDPAVSHPATFGYALLDRPETPQQKPQQPCQPVDRKTCQPRQYLETFVFPTLLPALEAMLKVAGEERCFDRKRTKFNACDFLTQYLYANNPTRPERRGTQLQDIPFVREEWARKPRPPLPLSVLLTDDQAVQIIQNYWRGFMIRREPEVQELRQWQREWRESNRDARRSVTEFWERRGLGPDVAAELAAGGDNDDSPRVATGDAAGDEADGGVGGGGAGRQVPGNLEVTLDYNHEDRDIASPKLFE